MKVCGALKIFEQFQGRFVSVFKVEAGKANFQSFVYERLARCVCDEKGAPQKTKKKTSESECRECWSVLRLEARP